MATFMYFGPEPLLMGKSWFLRVMAASQRGACIFSFMLTTAGRFFPALTHTGTATVVSGKPASVHIMAPAGSSPGAAPTTIITDAVEGLGMKSSKYLNLASAGLA